MIIENIKKNFIDNNRYLFIIISIIFGLCYLFEVPHGDDAELYLIESGKLVDCYKTALLLTRGSLYSLLTNTFIMYINSGPFYIFIILIMIIMYIMLETLRELFSKGKENENIINIFIICMVCAYPFVDMTSAGWIDTTLSYFMPVTFTFVSLIPIKRIYKNEQIKKYEYVVYLLSLLIAIDNTQAMAFLLVCYLSFAIYYFIKKDNNNYLIIALVLIFIAAYLVLTSPRFSGRVLDEIIRRFPTYGMINFLNKVDLGIFPTIRWIFFGNNIFVYVCLCTLALIIFNKYKNTIYRIISIFPILICAVFRSYINSNLAINAYDFRPIEYGTSLYGLFNLESIYSIYLPIQYAVLCLLLLLITLEILIIADKIEDYIIIFVVLAAGFGTRFVMAFTPTVFASHLRTYIYFAFSIILITIFLFSKNINLINRKYNKFISIVLFVIAVIMLGYFFAYVYNYMGSSLFDLLR